MSQLIGEGTQAYIYNRFVCSEHRNLCFKVFLPRCYAHDEYTILVELYRLGLSVPRPIEQFPEYHSYCMEKILGFNLEQVIKAGLFLSSNVIEDMLEALKEVCFIVEHGDLSVRNIMFGDITIENGIIIDAVPYVIDFGHSKIKPNPSSSEEWLNVYKAMKKIQK